MQKKRKTFPYVGSVYLMPMKNGNIVLLRRKNTGYEDGNYGLIAGHMEGSETATDAMIREAREEAGINLNPKDLKCVHVMHRLGPDDERIDFFFTASNWKGDIRNSEPEKCDHIDWFSMKKLPKNTIPFIKQAVEAYKKKKIYSEHGWI